MPFRGTRFDKGHLLLFLSIAFVCALYAPTTSRGLINYDDNWLVRDNFIVHRPLPDSIPTILFDTSKATRFTLGAEYLPVRDLSIAFDASVWADWYPGFHLTNLALYLAALVVWFAALRAWGFDKTLVGVAILIWAVHPAHAESVAWISERKGLLSVLFLGLTTWAFARGRTGRSAWFVLAAISAVFAVWSKAPAAVSLVVLVGLELVAPTARASWRRSLVGLACIGAAAALAFIPVVITAVHMRVVGDNGPMPSAVAGVHGFYVELAAMVVRNAVSYPIGTDGASIAQLLVGALSLIAALAVAFVPARAWFRPPPVVRVACMIWLAGWFPASRLVLPLRNVIVADRYILSSTLGFALVLAWLVLRIKSRIGVVLLAAIVLAASLRTFDAQSNWRDTVVLWDRATLSNPHDGDAWANYIEALGQAGRADLQFDAFRSALHKTPNSPRLLLHEALFVLERGDPQTRRDKGISIMRRSAELGEPRAMANLARLLLTDGKNEEALEWARRAVAVSPVYAKGFQTLGEVASTVGRTDEAIGAYRKALALAPDARTRFQLATVLVRVGEFPEARALLVTCLGDPELTHGSLAALAVIAKL